MSDIVEPVGSAQRILSDLVDAGFVERQRRGRRNRSVVRRGAPMLRHAAQEGQEIGGLLELLHLDDGAGKGHANGRTIGRMVTRIRARSVLGSLVFLFVAPGVVAGVVPWLLTGWEVRDPLPGWAVLRVAGALLIAVGAVVLLEAFLRFALQGLGTPAPVAPTEHLVVGGLYRYVRNPMYLAVAATIVGQALLLGQPVLLFYAAAFLAVVAAFVHWYEEPTLSRQFGLEYDGYRRSVPGWWPRWRA